VWNGLIDVIEGAINIFPDAINGVIDVINNIPGVDIDKLDGFDLSGAKLARGGVVDEPTSAIVGEAGKEAIIPLENNKQGLREIAQLLAEEIKAGGAAIVGSGDTVYNFYQTNNSPTALSQWEIYRQTQNLMMQMKGV
jgi:hypothetical protein